MQVVKPRPLYSQVYEAIKQDILNGTLKYGERINEVQISQVLNVSRGPVRESVSKLEQEGLLERNEKNQLTVYTPDSKDLTNIYECRKVLESLAAKMAAKYITEEQLKAMENLMNESNDLTKDDSENNEITKMFLDLNSEFHSIIIEASMNDRLMDQTRQLQSLTRLYRKFNIHNQERRKKAHQQHYEIYKALKERNELEASKFMYDHINYDMESLLAIFHESFEIV